jgi:hypothetical protein
MEARRSDISARILKGMKLSTVDYPLAAALSDLEAYYRAGTFTGGLLATSQVVAADAQDAAFVKASDEGLLPGTGVVVIPPKGGGSATGPSRGGGASGSDSAVRHRANFVPDNSTDILEKFLDPTGSGVRDPARSKIVTDLIAAKGLTVRLTRFLGAPEFATQRAAIVQDLKDSHQL